MLTADTAGAHNSILTVAVRVLLAIFPKAAVLAAFILSGLLVFIAEAQEINNPQEKCKNHPGLLALHCAAFSGDVAEVQRLLTDNAQVNANYGNQGEYGYYAPLHWAAQGGSADVIKELIKAGADLDAKDTRWGYTPLHFAASAGNAEAVDALVVAGADMMITASYNGRTPLHLAVHGGNIGVVEKLIKSGADINVHDKNHKTPLDYAKSENADIAEKFIEHLIKSGGINVADIDGDTPLHYAARNGNAEKVGKLIDAGANVNAGNRYNATPLDFAARSGSVGAVEKLIDAGASQEWALYYAAHTEKNTEIVELLIAAGADVNFNGGEKGKTPLYEAARLGNKEIVVILVNAGAKITTRTWEWDGKGAETTIGINAIEIAIKERGEYDPIAIFLREAAKARAQEMLEELE